MIGLNKMYHGDCMDVMQGIDSNSIDCIVTDPSASRECDIVLDPFCGSGTTCIAAKMLGRQYLGIEREEEYCEIARKRVAAIFSFFRNIVTEDSEVEEV